MTDIVERLNDSLSAGYSELRKEAAEEIMRLRAKVEMMEKQEPVGKFIQHPSHGMWEQDGYGDNPDAKPLYALPGAQPAPSVPEGWRLVPIEPTQEMRNAWDSSPICEDDDAEFRRAYSEMLAAAPEAKP